MFKLLLKWGRILALETVYKDFAKCLDQFLSVYYLALPSLLIKSIRMAFVILPDLTSLSDAIPTYLSLETACLITLLVWLALKMN